MARRRSEHENNPHERMSAPTELAARLQDEGAEAFVKSWNDLLAVITSKRAVLAKAS